MAFLVLKRKRGICRKKKEEPLKEEGLQSRMRKDRKKPVGRSGIYLGTAALAFFIGFGTPLSALADFGPGMSKEEWAELAPEENPGEGSLGEENPGGENLGEGIRERRTY